VNVMLQLHRFRLGASELQLNPRQIEAFRLVMLRGSATAAAHDLRISQPAVSRLIRDLELRAGLTLFERRANLLVPTPEAYLLLAEVERYASGLAAIASFAEELRERRRGTLSVVALPALAMGFLPRFVAAFIEGRDLAGVYVHGMPSYLVIDAVMGGQVEIGIAAAPPERPGLAFEPVVASAVLAVPSGHRLAAKRRARVQDIAGERLITLAEPSILSYPGATPLAGLAHDKSIATPLSGIACSLVAESVGVALVDPFSVADYLASGVTALPFKPAIDIRIAIVTNANRRLSALSREFIDAFKAHAEAHAAAFAAGRRPL